MQKIFAVIIMLISFSPLFAMNDADVQHGNSAEPTAINEKTEEPKEVKKQEWKKHFQFYGFIRNYFAYDSRKSKIGNADFFYFMPLDHDYNDLGDDLNQVSSFRFMALTSRVGVNVTGLRVGKTDFGAKVEADFAAGLSGVSGTAQLRLRQAYATVGWKDLPLSSKDKASVTLKIGQAWHPIAADLPQVFSLESGVPFGPFSRTPQVTMDANLGNHWTLTASALWQMQYTSAGLIENYDKASHQLSYSTVRSANYIKKSCTPETYFGLTYKTGGFVLKAGVDVLSIKPRSYGYVQNSESGSININGDQYTKVKVSDRITTASPMLYLQYQKDLFTLKAKTVYGSAGEHINLSSGYVVTDRHEAEGEDGHWDYAPLHTSSSWMSLAYGKKYMGVLFVGYMKNLGLSHAMDHKADANDIIFSTSGFANINQMYRINPEFLMTFGKFQVGIEWHFTAAQYGSKEYNERALPTSGLHWVYNNRVQGLVKFNF